MFFKCWALGPTYSKIHWALEQMGRVAPKDVVPLVFDMLDRDRPNLFRNVAAAAYCAKACAVFRTRRTSSIAIHYDLPFSFYSLFLDSDYQAYSCAIFADELSSLEVAQRHKFDILAKKLRASRGQRVLDIGCGWGSFLKYAREHALEAEGITLSRSQVCECRERGFRVMHIDAAEKIPGPADRLISVGMMEHAKDQRSKILGNAFGALTAGGRMVVQEMCRGGEPGNLPAAVFVAEEFFPGDYLGTYASIQRVARQAGFEVEHLECFGRHYRSTAIEWARRLAGRFPEAEAIVGYRTAMAHLICQAGFAWYFDVGAIDLVQYVLVKP